MALANYSDLQSAVASWLKRSDLTDQIPDFITLAERRLNRELRLRMTEQDATLSVSAGATTKALPTGFDSPIALWEVGEIENRELRFLNSTQMEVSTEQGKVEYWTINGANIQFERPSEAMTLLFRYIGDFSLSDASPTNWLLTNQPDVYLAASVTEGFIYLMDPDNAATWNARAVEAIRSINAEESRSRNLSTLSTDVPKARWRWEWATQ